MMFRNHRLYLSFLLASSALAWSVPAQAGALLDDPSEEGVSIAAIGTQSGTWDSNPLMLTQGAKSLYGSVTSPELIFTANTPTVKINADTTVNENVFNQTGFNSTDAHSVAGIEKKGAVWSFGIKERTDYDTTRTSELSNFGINILPIRHLGIQISPEISYTPTATHKFSLDSSVQRSVYDSSRYSDYDIVSVTPGYTHAFDERNSAIFTLQAQRYTTTTGAANRVDTVGPSVGWTSTLSPRLTAKVNVGVQATRGHNATTPVKPWKMDLTFSTDVLFKTQQDVATLSAGRAEHPFGNGTESLLTSFSLSDVHALNTRFAVNAGLNYQSASYPEPSPGSLKSQYGGNTGLTFHATDTLDIAATYQYRHESLVDVSEAAHNHTGGLTIVYHPYAWSM